MYTGTYFEANFINHVYEPTEYSALHLLSEFKHKWNVGDCVHFRLKHRKTNIGVITECAYSSERYGGGTINVYKINNKLVEESRIKSLVDNV